VQALYVVFWRTWDIYHQVSGWHIYSCLSRNYIPWPLAFSALFAGLGTILMYCRFWRVLTMVYNTQDYWVFWTFPSSCILETRKHDVSETDPVSETSCFLVSRILDDGKVQKPQ
jgi:hypothetical protein